MADIAIEVYREEVDDLTRKIRLVIEQELLGTPYIDRAIIVAAALANVACGVDAAEEPYSPQCTTRLKACADSWEIGL